MVDRIRPASVRQKQVARTCCDLCHIKLGSVFLGCIETVIAIFVLIGAVQQVIWKNRHSSQCDNHVFRDCLIYQFNHFNVTLIFDYIVILMMFFILFSVLLLFCAILTDTSCLVLPHIFIQAIFLLFSVGYFFLYAWSYFYGDLYTHKRPFMFQSCVERMWLATLLLVLAGLQTYLFSSVIRCSLYIANIEDERRRRESAFERCSERVRLAKENGLWRTTSWGGGFQQYKGQYDNPRKEVKNKGFHVQWNTDVESAKILGNEEEDVVELANIPEEVVVVEPIIEAIENRKTVSKQSSYGSNRSEERRSSGSSSRRTASESPKKDRPRMVKKTSSEGQQKLEPDVRRMSKDGTKSHHHHHGQKGDSKEDSASPKRTVKLRPTESSKESIRRERPPLRSNRSVDSGDHFDEVVVFNKEKHHSHRRRSSEDVPPQQILVHQHKFRTAGDKKGGVDLPIVKKVSITATML